MGLFDKLKNVFFEEEYVEVDEPVKAEPREKVTVAKKIETPEVKKKEENLSEDKFDDGKYDVKELEKLKEETTSRFPMSFDDKDFEIEKTMELEEPIRDNEREEVVEKYSEEDEPVEKETVKYEYEEYYQEPVKETREEIREENNDYHGLYEGGKEKEKQEKKGFTPSPIISPIYGILDKNYRKEEIVSKREVRLSQVSNKKADLDLIREKAYGDLAGDITASIEEDLYEEPKEKEKKEKEDLLYDLNDEESPTVKTVTVGDAEEYFNDLGLEYNVDYKVEKETKDDSDEYKEKSREVSKINFDESNEEDKNLFDLIDSMYEDKE